MPKYIKRNVTYAYDQPDYEEVFKELGSNLRSLRLQLGLTLDDVSEQTHIDKATLSRLESGSQNPKFGTVISIAHVLGTDPTTLCPTLFPSTRTDGDWVNLYALYSRLPERERLEVKNCVRAMLIGFRRQME